MEKFSCQEQYERMFIYIAYPAGSSNPIKTGLFILSARISGFLFKTDRLFNQARYVAFCGNPLVCLITERSLEAVHDKDPSFDGRHYGFQIELVLELPSVFQRDR